MSKSPYYSEVITVIQSPSPTKSPSLSDLELLIDESIRTGNSSHAEAIQIVIHVLHTTRTKQETLLYSGALENGLQMAQEFFNERGFSIVGSSVFYREYGQKTPRTGCFSAYLELRSKISFSSPDSYKPLRDYTQECLLWSLLDYELDASPCIPEVYFGTSFGYANG